MPSAQTEWDTEKVRRWFADRAAASAGPPPAASRYHQAAAVLGSFDQRTLLDAAGNLPGSAELSRLLSDCIPVGGDGVRWSLKADIRCQVLSSFTDAEALRAALAWNAHRPAADPLQIALDVYILGSAADLAQQTEEQLASSAQVVSWLSGTPAAQQLHLPDVDAVRRRLDFVRLLSPLRLMAGEHFRGRKKELARLRDFVLSPAEEDLAPKPLVMHGFGGCGKTTLVARLLLEYAAGHPGGGPGPFVFLDFDRPSLVPEEPATLLLEAARQLAVQSSDPRPAAESLALQLEHLLRDRTESRTLGGAPGQLLTGNTAAVLLNQFADLFRTGVWAGRPLLLVLDTFEEVQYHSQRVVEHVWAFIGQLRSRVPEVRVVVAGRAPVVIDGVTAPASETIPLDELDADAAVSCLAYYGVPDETGRFIYDCIGGNPLALRLAGELARTEPALGLREFLATKFARRLDETLIQAILFRRFLGHVKDKDVRKLAHPGLTLRRITPELVRDVLAGPCKVSVPNLRRAEELCAELARETGLVVQDAGGGLRHRPELRRQMLHLLRHDRPAQLEAIHRAAAEYYRPRDDDQSQAERFYHLLCLGRPREELDTVWRPALEPFLLSSRDELPEDALRYLASRSGGGFESVTTTAEEWREHELVTWERKSARWALELIQLDRYEEVDRELRRRPERTLCSPLFRIHARVLRALGQHEAAAGVLENALNGWRPDGSRAEQIDLLLLLVRVLIDLDRGAEAESQLRSAEQLIGGGGSREQTLEAAVAAVRLAGNNPRPAMSRLVGVLRDWKDSELRSIPVLARKAAAELIDFASHEAARVVRSVGLGPLDPAYQKRLAGALIQWDDAVASRVEDQSRRRFGIAFHAGFAAIESVGVTEWERWVGTTSPDQIGERIARMLDEFEPTESVVAVMRSILRGRDDVADHRSAQARTLETRLSRGQFLARLQGIIETSFIYDELSIILFNKFNINIINIINKGSFGSTIFDLITYFERRGQLLQLIHTLAAERPMRHDWAEFIQTAKTSLSE